MEYSELFKDIFLDVYGHEMTGSESDKENAEIIMRTLKSVFGRIYNAPPMSEVINGTTNIIHAQQPGISQIRL